jgi:RHS repeat-associated protein
VNRAGRVATSLKGGVNQGAYTYDGFERLRVRVVANQTPTTNNGTTHYVWNLAGQIIAEANGATGASLRETVYLDAMPLAAVDVVASPKKLYAVHVDHLNRPIMLTDAAKTNVWSASYEPFGKVRTLTGTVTQNLGLPGQWFQLEHGLAYNWHRHYDPTTGRYTTPDPLGFVDGPSVFAYVGSSPQTKVDPSGLLIGGLGSASALSSSSCNIEQIGNKKSPTLFCIGCDAPGGSEVCADCFKKNSQGQPILRPDGIVIPPFTLPNPRKK